MIPISFNQLMEAMQSAGVGGEPKKTGVKSRIKHAHAFVYMMRSTGTMHCIDGSLPPVERDASEHERRAYNNALELLANFFSGEISTEPLDDDEDDLPGPDLAVKYPVPPDPPAPAFPAPVMITTGDLVTKS